MILVTGAGGYIGSNLIQALEAETEDIRCLSLGTAFVNTKKFVSLPVQYLTERETYFDLALADVTQIIFLASSAQGDPLINILYPSLLAKRALQTTNMSRFIFISSCKVYGEYGIPGTPFTSASPTSPKTEYGRSKILAEDSLINIFEGQKADLVIFRLPNIVGRNSSGLFRFLVNSVKRKSPIPISGKNALKSFLGCNELCSIIKGLAEQKRSSRSSANTLRVNLKIDDQDVHYGELIQLISEKVGRKPLLLPVKNINFFSKRLKNLTIYHRFKGIYSDFQIITSPSDEKFIKLLPSYRNISDLINESV